MFKFQKGTKMTAALLSLLLLAGALGGCGGDDNGSGSKESSKEEAGSSDAQKPASEEEAGEEEPADGDGEVVKLRVWGMTNSASNPDIDEVAEAISQITREKIGAEVELIRSNDGEKLNLALTSGEQLDLVNIHTYPGGLPSMVGAGYCLPTDDLLEQYGQDIRKIVPEDYLKCGMVDGVLYMIPNMKDTARGAGFAMRQDVLDELEINPADIKTWEDVHDVLAKVKEAKPDMYPLVPSWAGGGMQNAMPYDELGGGLGILESCFADSTTVVDLYETDTYREFCERMYQWNQEGLIMPDATTTTENNLMSTVGFADYENLKPGKALECKRGWGVEVALVQMVEPYTYTDCVGGSSFVIPAVTEHPDKAMQLLNLMFSDPEVSNLFVNGIEGKHWEYMDDTKTCIRLPEGADSTASGYESLDWAWPNMRITPVWEGADSDLWDQMDSFTGSAKSSPAMGFRFDSTNVLNEITACGNVTAKYDLALRWGELNPEEALPKFIEELKAAGVDVIVAEKQKQLDEWLENSK